MLSTNNIIEGSFCLYVVTFVVFLVLSERLEQATSKHVCKLFWNIKTVFRRIRTEQNVKSRQSLIISKLSRWKAWFLNMFFNILFSSKCITLKYCFNVSKEFANMFRRSLFQAFEQDKENYECNDIQTKWTFYYIIGG